MEFEWDRRKNSLNVSKHGIGFETARLIFDRPVLSAVDGRAEYGEVRIKSIGQAANGVVLVVVHTDRNGVIRIISARPASRKERQMYGEAVR